MDVRHDASIEGTAYGSLGFALDEFAPEIDLPLDGQENSLASDFRSSPLVERGKRYRLALGQRLQL